MKLNLATMQWLTLKRIRRYEMKILKNNYNNIKQQETTVQINPYPRKTICEQCQSELEYEKSDLIIGALGCVYIDCPLCGHNIMLDENENSISLTKDNISFPTHFFHTSEETGAVDMCNNEEIKERICKAINYFRKNKDEFVWYSYCGNLCVIVFRYDGDEDYEVIVTNNYYNTYIPFETKDYTENDDK